jgi:hypothetical protein
MQGPLSQRELKVIIHIETGILMLANIAHTW